MTATHSIRRSLTPAAAYIRMSSGKQERSPAQQRGEIAKLAQAESCRLVHEFSDEAITGDSGPEQRPGFRAMLEAAERGEFQVLLLENGDRLGRFDSLAGAEYYNRLRQAGIRIVTCSDGEIDLTSFEGRVVHTVRQEGRHAFLRDLSRKVVRGQIANAKAGNSNGAPAPYGMDRVLVNQAGEAVRRLVPGESVRMPGHRVRHVPSKDTAKLAAVRYMFERFANADLTYQALAHELADRGYPRPRETDWRAATVSSMLRNQSYRGSVCWGLRTSARYCTSQGDAIVQANGKQGRKPVEEAVLVEADQPGIIPPKLFDRVQRKVAKRYRTRAGRRGDFPLSGLIYCEHCGQPMHATVGSRRDRQGRLRYQYPKYLCSSYSLAGRRNKAGCGYFHIKADQVQGWLTTKLREVFLGPGREALVAEIEKHLRATATHSRADAERLGKRVAKLDAEVGRLVKAVRTLDAPELLKELAGARAERDRLKAELSRATAYNAPEDIQAEAERIADLTWELAGRLSEASPAALRELFQRMVSKIACRWTRAKDQTGRIRCQLVGGKVYLKPSPLFVLSEAHASRDQ